MKLQKGLQVGNWTIISDIVESKVLARCACGREVIRRVDMISKGKSTSCNIDMCNSARKPMTGKRYGKLLVLEDYLPNKRIRVKCDCGNIVLKDKEQVSAGNTVSCHQGLCKSITKDLTGQKFGMLTAVKLIRREGKPQSFWECKCDCGQIKTIRASGLLSSVKSCGCQKGVKLIKDIEVVGSRHVFGQYKRQAKSRNLPFDLTFEEFSPFLKKNCHYCGSLPSNKWKAHRKRGGVYHYTGVDRKDSKFGYSLENCVPCCGKCNTVKNRSHHDDFLERIKLISSHLSLS